MLFHVIATHQAHTCPANLSLGEGGAAVYESTIGRVTDKSVASDANIKLVAALVNGPAHKIFLTLDAADTSQLVEFLAPLKLVGECDVMPVTDLTG